MRCPSSCRRPDWLAHASTALLCGGLVFAVSREMREAFFFVCVIAFLLSFLLHLIDDLDNSFGLADSHSAEDISLEGLKTAVSQLEAEAGLPAA